MATAMRSNLACRAAAICLTTPGQPFIVEASTGVPSTEALQKRSFAFRPAAPQALPENPGERGGSGFLPDTSLGWTRITLSRPAVLQYPAHRAPGGDRHSPAG